LRRCADLVVLALSGALACSVTSPETDVRAALARPGPVRVDGADGEAAHLDSVRFADVTVSMDGPRALVLAVAEADGRLRSEGGEAKLAYVGREAFEMERCPAPARWCAVGGPLPVLRSVLAVLPELRRATAASAATPRPVRDVAWQIRVERDAAAVGEDWWATDPAAPPRTLRSRYELVRDRDGWRRSPPP
jgi:hypothetical protein